MSGTLTSEFQSRVQNRPRLIEAYCPSCGIFIAASPKEHILQILEKMHYCPPNACDPDHAAEFGRSRIIRYALK
jgi:hypothetical protein